MAKSSVVKSLEFHRRRRGRRRCDATVDERASWPLKSPQSATLEWNASYVCPPSPSSPSSPSPPFHSSSLSFLICGYDDAWQRRETNDLTLAHMRVCVLPGGNFEEERTFCTIYETRQSSPSSLDIQGSFLVEHLKIENLPCL